MVPPEPMRTDSLKTLLGMVSEGVLLHDVDGAVLYCNSTAARLLGQSSADVVGRSDPFSSSARRAGRSVATVASDEPAMRALRTRSAVPPRALRLRDAQGTEVWVEVSSAPVIDSRTASLQGAVTILKEHPLERSVEEQARGRQRMEVMGRLAGSVAHDFNNLLTVILGYTSMLLDGLDPTDDRWREADEVRKAAQRGADLTRQLLAISRGQIVEARVLDANVLLFDMLPMLRQIVGSGIHVEMQGCPGVAAVRVDLGQLEQLVMNLVINARDAMPGGGRIDIRVSVVDLDDDFVSSHIGSRAGRFVRLDVQDDGCGMDESTRQRIFEPFFTTKGHDKGTGLGLATVYGIVKQHGGYVDVLSRPGCGATFQLYLPLRNEQPEAPRRPRRAAPRRREAGRVLLVVEDDQVRRFARRVLLRSGYEVTDEVDGLRALARFETLDEPLEVLVADLALPGLSGVELAKRLRHRCPGLRVLFLSGYADGSLESTTLPLPGARLLAKPFRPESLLDELRVLPTSNAPTRKPTVRTG